MRMSILVGRRHKERPADAVLDSHALMLRGGYMRQVFSGLYSLLPPGQRVVKKIEAILRQEMDRIDGQEVLMPVVLPRELWDESGRYAAVGDELLRFSDRTGHGMVLGMTHEEAVVQLARHEVPGHKQFPFMLYQLQTKYRDEPRARAGLIRVREFTMKDAYSFHTTPECLEAYYRRVALAYARIYARAGLPEVVVVASDPGMMGGKIAHEYMLLADGGEDTIVTCDGCDAIANREVAAGLRAAFPEEPKPLEEVETPGQKTIEDLAKFLGVEERQCCKAVFYKEDDAGRLVLVLVRGDVEVNEAKLAKIIRRPPVFADDARIRAAGAVPGSASALGLAKDVRVVADRSVAESGNFVAGANREGWHVRNFNLARDAAGAEVVDVAQAADGDGCPHCGGRLVLKRGIEVGNIFQLGDRYTGAMRMRYLDADGKEATPIMGCYGIGVGRLAACVIEARHDEYGPIWPASVAPWTVHVCALKASAPEVRDAAEKLYAELNALGVEALYDDRGESTGAQFADADLLGAPLRFIVSQRNLKEGMVEWKARGREDKGQTPVADAAAFARQWVADEIARLDRHADTLACPI